MEKSTVKTSCFELQDDHKNGGVMVVFYDHPVLGTVFQPIYDQWLTVPTAYQEPNYWFAL